MYFEDRRIENHILYARAVGQVEEYNNANRTNSRQEERDGTKDIWEPPPQGFIKINTDVAVLLGGQIGVGGVAKDAAGRVLWCFSENVDVDAAEGFAMLRGLQHATTRNSHHIIMESDSQSLIKTLQNPMPNLSLFGTMIEDILSLRRSFAEVCFEWIRRTGNSVAHNLAASAFQRVEPFYSETLPNEHVLNVIVDAER